MTVKLSPGRWFLSFIPPDRAYVPIAGEIYRISTDYGSGYPTVQESVYNARLIEVAKELYEFAQSAIEDGGVDEVGVVTLKQLVDYVAKGEPRVRETDAEPDEEADYDEDEEPREGDGGYY